MVAANFVGERAGQDKIVVPQVICLISQLKTMDTQTRGLAKLLTSQLMLAYVDSAEVEEGYLGYADGMVRGEMTVSLQSYDDATC